MTFDVSMEITVSIHKKGNDTKRNVFLYLEGEVDEKSAFQGDRLSAFCFTKYGPEPLTSA